jgi:hypothetical protein
MSLPYQPKRRLAPEGLLSFVDVLPSEANHALATKRIPARRIYATDVMGTVRRYWRASLGSGGCGPSRSILPWSSRNGGYRSVINAT